MTEMTFEVATMVLEPEEVLRIFAEHCVAQGAVRILMYYDDVPDEGLLSDIPQVQVIPCDAALWERLGRQKEHSLEERQWMIYDDAYAQCEADWMLFCDADELIAGPQTIAETLSKIPADVEGIHLPTAEAMFGPGDDINRRFSASYFRTPIRVRGMGRIMGLLSQSAQVRPFLKQGLTGHNIGKQMLRKGLSDVEVHSHKSKRGGELIPLVKTGSIPGLGMLYCYHYDAMSFHDWERKWRRRVDGASDHKIIRPVRFALQDWISEALDAGDKTANAAFAALYCTTRFRFWCLSLAGFGHRRLGLPSGLG